MVPNLTQYNLHSSTAARGSARVSRVECTVVYCNSSDRQYKSEGSSQPANCVTQPKPNFVYVNSGSYPVRLTCLPGAEKKAHALPYIIYLWKEGGNIAVQMSPDSATLWLTGGFECGNASLVTSTNAINPKPERDKSISLFIAFYSCVLNYCVCKAPIKARPQTPRDAEEEPHDDLGVVAAMVLSTTSPAHAGNHPRRIRRNGNTF